MRQIAYTVAAVVLAIGANQAMAGGKGTTVSLDGLKSTTPSNWKQQEPDTKLGRFRKYQFAIPKAGGDKENAELVIFHFGGSGGSNDANIDRWKKMFAPPPGKTIDDVSKVEKLKVGDVPVVYVDIHGTYLTKFPPFAPNAKVIPKENYRFLGAIFDSKDGPYYIRLTGPARTVEANKKGFDEWLKGFK